MKLPTYTHTHLQCCRRHAAVKLCIVDCDMSCRTRISSLPLFMTTVLTMFARKNILDNRKLKTSLPSTPIRRVLLLDGAQVLSMFAYNILPDVAALIAVVSLLRGRDYEPRRPSSHNSVVFFGVYLLLGDGDEVAGSDCIPALMWLFLELAWLAAFPFNTYMN